MERLRDLAKEESKEIKRVLSNCLEKEEAILFAYLHGSFAEGKPFRNIDIAVFVVESKIPKEKATDFEMLISLKLEKIVKVPIDVKIINFAPLAFQFYKNMPEYPPALLGDEWPPSPLGERVRVRGKSDLCITPTLILPHQGGGRYFRDLDAPQLAAG